MEPNVSNKRLLRTLKRKPEGHILNLVLYSAIQNLAEGKKLKSSEFHEIHAVLFKSGPCVK
jgi:hypothetical protein